MISLGKLYAESVRLTPSSDESSLFSLKLRGGVFPLRFSSLRHRHSVIAFDNGAPGGTKNTIDYAEKKGIEVVVSQTNIIIE